MSNSKSSDDLFNLHYTTNFFIVFGAYYSLLKMLLVEKIDQHILDFCNMLNIIGSEFHLHFFLMIAKRIKDTR